MSTTNNIPSLQFDSKRIPGSVLVRHNNRGIAAIVVNREENNEEIKVGDRFVMAITKDALGESLLKIKSGTYQEVKEQVIKAVEQHTKNT